MPLSSVIGGGEEHKKAHAFRWDVSLPCAVALSLCWFGFAGNNSYAGSPTWRVDNPYDGSLAAEVPIIHNIHAQRMIDQSASVQRTWKSTTVAQRIELVQK
jgi:hypothetical protein